MQDLLRRPATQNLPLIGNLSLKMLSVPIKLESSSPISTKSNLKPVLLSAADISLLKVSVKQQSANATALSSKTVPAQAILRVVTVVSPTHPG
jgi:hypothetical protein